MKITVDEVIKIMAETKAKNSAGADRIPMRIIVDAKQILAPTICDLINKIFATKMIPDQWKVSRILPLHKKGDKHDIENYRPISNICSIAKIFEKSLLFKLQEMEKQHQTDLTGNRQHGFKKGHSTVTAMLEIQDIIAEAVDKGHYCAMISLDLSAAFDVVNHSKLFKVLSKMGIPKQYIDIIREWLKDRRFYVEVNGQSSIFKTITCGTLQGSVLGPILFALFMSPVFDLADLVTYADDNYIMESDSNLDRALAKVKMKAETIIQWLLDVRMKVNTNKTELCIFSKNDVQTCTMELAGTEIKSKKNIKVLGVIFDSKLNWHNQVISQITSCRRTLCGLKLIRKYFSSDEFLNVINAMFYSKLYYACQVWLIPSLNQKLKNRLFSCSSQALRLITGDDYKLFSFDELHCMFNRAKPQQWSNYMMASQLHSIVNNEKPFQTWLNLQTQISINNRTGNFIFNRTNKLRVGLNQLHNRLNHIAEFLVFNDFNLSRESFKIKIKRTFVL